MRRLPFDNGEFDTVLMIEVLEHVREQREAVREALRVLRAGGVLVLATPHALDQSHWWNRLRYRNALTPESAGLKNRVETNPFVAEAGIPHEPYFHDAFTFEQLKRLVGPEGEIIELHSLYMHMPGARVAGRLPPRLQSKIKTFLSGTQLSSEQPATPRPYGDCPLPVPTLDPQAALMVKVSKVMWRIPAFRWPAVTALLVARAPSDSHDWSLL